LFGIQPVKASVGGALMASVRRNNISEGPARLSSRDEHLVIDREGAPSVRVAFRDVAALIVSHPQVVYTHGVLAKLAAARGAFIVADEKRQPTAILLHIDGHVTQAERFAKQAAAPAPLRKRLWTAIVGAKVLAQARVLIALRGTDGGLKALAERIRSGDPANVEARAARRYWAKLFPTGDFQRNREADDANRLLNFGYAVVRAVIARAACAAGLHPSVGLHHHNRYDVLCLASDLMEPFRPLVDRRVAELVEQRGADVPLDKDVKAALIGVAMERYRVDDQQRSLFDIAARTASSLASVILGEGDDLWLPAL
jgi:CRISPR-associated protein Cas1